MSYERFAYTYDRLMEEMPYPEWLRFLEECWSKYGKPKNVADLGCGTGSIAVPLAQAGMNVICIDLSSDMLAVASQKADEYAEKIAAARGSIVLLEQDMREWTWTEPLDAVISFCDSLNYILEEEDILRTFGQTYEGLKKGGIFIFDMHSPSLLRQYAVEQPFVLDEEDVSYIWTCELDEERLQIEHDLTIFTSMSDSAPTNLYNEDVLQSDTQTNCNVNPLYNKFYETHIQRAYPPNKIRQWLVEAGFEKVESYADFKWEPLTADSKRMFFVAWKK